MEIKFEECKQKDSSISFTIKNEQINGITGTHLEDIIDIIKIQLDYKGKIIVDKKELKKDGIISLKKKINLVEEQIRDNLQGKSIWELMIKEIEKRNLYPKNVDKKITDSLKIVGLNKSYLERSYYSLSTSEKKLVQIAMSLLTNPEVIILESPFRSLDLKNQKKIMILLQKMKEQYHKTIVMVCEDAEMIYQYTDYVVLYTNNKILLEGKTMDVYKNVELLKKHKMMIPEIVEFTYIAKKEKKAKIDYYKDIRDLIKDIYKHV